MHAERTTGSSRSPYCVVLNFPPDLQVTAPKLIGFAEQHRATRRNDQVRIRLKNRTGVVSVKYCRLQRWLVDMKAASLTGQLK